MISNDFQHIIKLIDEKLRERARSRGEVDQGREWILARTVKFAEESGELAGEVLTTLGSQREEKINEQSKDDLGSEIADVLITTLLVAKSLGVDVNESLRRKVEKIRNRFRID